MKRETNCFAESPIALGSLKGCRFIGERNFLDRFGAHSNSLSALTFSSQISTGIASLVVSYADSDNLSFCCCRDLEGISVLLTSVQTLSHTYDAHSNSAINGDDLRRNAIPLADAGRLASHSRNWTKQYLKSKKEITAQGEACHGEHPGFHAIHFDGERTKHKSVTQQ